MTGKEFYELFLRPLTAKLGQDEIILVDPKEYEQLKKDFNFTDEDVKRWARGDLDDRD